MTMTDSDYTTPSERIYDEQIAPLLLEVGRLCERHGMPMLATVWFDGEACGTTRVPPKEPSPSWTLAEAARRCGGNVDSLVMGLARTVAPENDGSIVLRMFRRGTTPEG